MSPPNISCAWCSLSPLLDLPACHPLLPPPCRCCFFTLGLGPCHRLVVHPCRYRVSFLKFVTLTDISFDFTLTRPTRSYDLQLGSNIESINYYMSAWMFKDLWRSAPSPSGDGVAFSGFDENGGWRHCMQFSVTFHSSIKN